MIHQSRVIYDVKKSIFVPTIYNMGELNNLGLEIYDINRLDNNYIIEGYLTPSLNDSFENRLIFLQCSTNSKIEDTLVVVNKSVLVNKSKEIKVKWNYQKVLVIKRANDSIGNSYYLK